MHKHTEEILQAIRAANSGMEYDSGAVVGSGYVKYHEPHLEHLLVAMNEKLQDDTYAVGKHGCTHKPEGLYVLHEMILSESLTQNLEENEPLRTMLHGLLVGK